MYGWGARNMPILIVAGTAAAIGAYSSTKEKMWLWGAAAFSSIITYTFLVMKKTNARLNQILKESGEAEELKAPEKEEAVDKMQSWIGMHRVRLSLALASAAIFFVAKQYTKNS